MTDHWRVPPGMKGNPRLVRIGTGMVGDDDLTCPSCVSAKARPAIQPKVRPAKKKAPLETFALGPVMTALDRIEFRDLSVRAALDHAREIGKPLHPGLLVFTQHAVRMYLEREPAGDLDPVADTWVAQNTTSRSWELYAWGRRYQSSDQRIREFRFLRFGKAGVRDRSATQVAMAAFSTAFGAPAAWPAPQDWSQPFEVRSVPTRVERVRVVEIGLLDGSRHVHFDGTSDEVEAYFAEHGRAQVPRIAEGTAQRPGASCASCKQLTACETLPRLPGLLGLTTQQAPIRTVSISDLRYYRLCPAQAHLRGLNLPRASEYSPEAELGHAVHGWLEALHGGTGEPMPCTVSDMPTGDTWSGGGWRVSGEMAALGRRMLARHPDVCPFQEPSSISTVRLEPRLTFHDTAAQTVVIAKPDMVYLDGGAWVWREVKTTQKSRWFHSDPLDEFPQLALAVILLAECALGGDPEGSRVELEALRPGGSDLSLIDPTDAERVDKARDVVRRLAMPWRDDEAFEARPGKNCRWCPVSQWCPSFPRAELQDAEGGS